MDWQEYIESNAVWVALLSNGESVTQDERFVQNAWYLLKEKCKKEKLNIEKIWVKFRSNVSWHILPEKAEGYFFIKSLLQGFGDSSIAKSYTFGYIVGDKVYTKRIKIPELVFMEEGERDLSKCPEECIIINRPYGGNTG